jgi:DNA-binding LacI/PurR family transcriptional regulator
VVSQGCRRLLRVRPVLKPIPDWLRRRDIGHERALREAGLPILPPLDVAGLVEAVNDASLFGQMTHLLAGHLFGHLSTGQPVDALLAVSDGHLAEVAGACRILGKDPASDVVLTGYDNCWKECPEFQWEPTPPRATVDKRDVAIGENLAEMLLSRLNRTRSAAPQSRLVPQTLVVV